MTELSLGQDVPAAAAVNPPSHISPQHALQSAGRASPAFSAWAWQPVDSNPIGPRFVSPFLTTNEDDTPRRSSADAATAAEGMVVAGGATSNGPIGSDFRTAPPPIQTQHFYPAPTAQHAFSTDLHQHGGAPHEQVTPRSAKSPIGTLASNGDAHLMRKTSYPGIVGLKSLDTPFNTGVQLTLTDDADLGAKGPAGGTDMDFLNSPYTHHHLGSHSSSPLATPTYEMSPSSPSESSYSQSMSNSSHSHFTSGAPSRGEEQFDALEKSLTAMIFNNSERPTPSINSIPSAPLTHRSGSASTPASAHFGPQPTKSLSVQATPPFQSHAQPQSAQLQPQPTQSSSGNSPPGSVAYIVLPNGQVQTVDIATIQNALQPNASTSNMPPPGPTVRETSGPSLIIPPSRTNSNQQPPRYPAYGQQATEYADAPTDADSLNFSLSELSTKTLPLFSPPTPPLPQQHQQQQSSLNARSNVYQPMQQQQQQQQQAPQHHHQHRGSLSNSTYSSPSTMSMQQRAMHRQQGRSNGLIHDYAGEQQQQQQQPQRPAPHYTISAPSPSQSPIPSIGLGGTTNGLDQAQAMLRNLANGPLVQVQSQIIPSIVPSGNFYSHLPGSDSMVAQAKSQAGSRMLQTKLQNNDPVFFTQVFDEVYESLPELMVDLFGNYLVQKLIVFANDTQRLQLLLKVLPELLEISCDRQGTRAIQKLIETLKHQHERQMVLDWLSLPLQGQAGQQQAPESQPLLRQLSPSSSPRGPMASPNSSPLLPQPTSPNEANSPSSPPFAHPPMPRLIHLIRDQNGSHVVHSILDTFPQNMLHNIQRNAMKNCRSLGVDQHGLCVLKKCLSMAPAADFIYFNLKLILEHIHEYVNNQYGNYLLQHIIERTNGLNHAASSSALAREAASKTVGNSSNNTDGSNNNGASTSNGNSTSTAPISNTSASALALVSECDDAVRPQLHVINDAIFRALRGSFARLSRQKFSSNVVEKMLKIPDPNIRSAIIAELIEPESIASLLQCSYGNYVLTNVLYVASAEECALLCSRVRPEPVLASLRKNIRAKWEKLLANAHFIHPGLPPQGPPQQQHSASAPATPAMMPTPGHALLPDPTGMPTSDTSTSGQQSNGSTFPTPAAIQLITSILGAGAPSGGGNDYAASNGSSSLNPSNVASPTASPPIRSIGGSSPSFPTRQFGRVNSVGGSGQSYRGGNGSNIPEHRRSYGPGSNAGSAVNSPHLSSGSLNFSSHRQQLVNYNASVSASSSPNVHYRSVGANQTQQPNSAGFHSTGNYPNSSPPTPTMHSTGHADFQQHHHMRAPSNSSYHNHSNYQSGNGYQAVQQSSRNPSSDRYNGVSGGSANPVMTTDIQQQIRETQNQLAALMALQNSISSQTAQQQQPQQHRYTQQQQSYGQFQ